MNLRNKIFEFRKKIDSLDTNKKNHLLMKCSAISGSQKGVWFKYRENLGDNSYNLGFLVKLSADLNEQQVREAAIGTLNRHPILRVFFYEFQTTVHMIPLPSDFAFVETVTVLDEKALLASVHTDYAQPFDLESNVPCYFKIYKADDELYLCFMAQYTSDSQLKFEIPIPTPIPIPKRIICTVPHHGSENNKDAILKLLGKYDQQAFFVRNSESKSQIPGQTYITKIPYSQRYCDICPQYGNMKQQVEFTISSGIWRPKNCSPCRC